MTKRQKHYRKLHNIATRNVPKTKDGTRRTDKTEWSNQTMRRYNTRLTTA
jgi:predicted subunit of tRNA(5-methylaminomethyl-2-thiouridylate) methyltransferase